MAFSSYSTYYQVRLTCEWEQLEVISAVSLAVAVLSILACYKTLKPNIAGHRALLKLLAFKLLVGITFVENVRLRVPENND